MALLWGGYIQPNVSLCEDNDKIHYNINANGHSYMDLGLPSGTLWATCNVGASKPSDYGLYFQWGDTQGYTANQVGTGEGKKKFATDYSDYKWRLSGDNEDNVAFTKYATNGATLELEDDAAHVHMGGSWHMPTLDQLDELTDNTTTAWTTLDGVSGVTFTSTKDTSKSIFIPAAGNAWDGSVQDSGDYGYVWSSIVDTGQSIYTDFLTIGPEENNIYTDSVERWAGYSVRGVIG